MSVLFRQCLNPVLTIAPATVSVNDIYKIGDTALNQLTNLPTFSANQVACKLNYALVTTTDGNLSNVSTSLQPTNENPTSTKLVVINTSAPCTSCEY
jgi:hypothetical protein